MIVLLWWDLLVMGFSGVICWTHYIVVCFGLGWLWVGRVLVATIWDACGFVVVAMGLLLCRFTCLVYASCFSV